MKKEILRKLTDFQSGLKQLKADVDKNSSEMISKKAIRNRADMLAMQWVDELRSPLEHKFKLHPDDIANMAEQMKKLHLLCNGHNRQVSYQKVLKAALRKFSRGFIVPVKQHHFEAENVFDLRNFCSDLPAEESEYMEEAVGCADKGHLRAAVVMGWCAAIDKIQKQIIRQVGLDKFNSAYMEMRQKNPQRFREWRKEISASSLGDLQELPDGYLIAVLKYLDFVDSNQSKRLHTCIQYRNQSAHPGEAPIKKVHLDAFFTDIGEIVFNNPKIKG